MAAASCLAAPALRYSSRYFMSRYYITPGPPVGSNDPAVVDSTFVGQHICEERVAQHGLTCSSIFARFLFLVSEARKLRILWARLGRKNSSQSRTGRGGNGEFTNPGNGSNLSEKLTSPLLTGRILCCPLRCFSYTRVCQGIRGHAVFWTAGRLCPSVDHEKADTREKRGAVRMERGAARGGGRCPHHRPLFFLSQVRARGEICLHPSSLISHPSSF